MNSVPLRRKAVSWSLIEDSVHVRLAADEEDRIFNSSAVATGTHSKVRRMNDSVLRVCQELL